jgi:hypothetical protein
LRSKRPSTLLAHRVPRPGSAAQHLFLPLSRETVEP